MAVCDRVPAEKEAGEAQSVEMLKRVTFCRWTAECIQHTRFPSIASSTEPSDLEEVKDKVTLDYCTKTKERATARRERRRLCQ